jgi:hypothetical protein
MGNDGLPMSIVILISVVFVSAISLAGLIVYVLLNGVTTAPAA